MPESTSKYKYEYNEQAYKLCLLGATDIELADFFRVCEATINNWKNDFPLFLESVKKGKIIADADVAESLHKKALGYKYTETTKEPVFNPNENTFDYIISKEVLKEVPPDTGAAMAWLKNRQPKKWRDNRDVDVNINQKLEDFIK